MQTFKGNRAAAGRLITTNDFFSEEDIKTDPIVDIVEDDDSAPIFENLESIAEGENWNSKYSGELSRDASRQSKMSRTLELANQNNIAGLNARKWLQKFNLTPTLDDALTQKDCGSKYLCERPPLKTRITPHTKQFFHRKHGSNHLLSK